MEIEVKGRVAESTESSDAVISAGEQVDAADVEPTEAMGEQTDGAAEDSLSTSTDVVTDPSPEGSLDTQAEGSLDAQAEGSFDPSTGGGLDAGSQPTPSAAGEPNVVDESNQSEGASLAPVNSI